jgi:prepilin-type processing-associated H-X9-DG protein
VLALVPGTWPIGLVLGIVALRQIRGNPARLSGRGLARPAIPVGVVLTVLAILLLPGLLNPAPKARSASCLNNTKQLALAFLLYTQDSDDHAPPARTWADALSPYVKNDVVFRCVNCRAADACNYAYSMAIGGADMSRFPDRAVVHVVWDSDMGWNGYGDLTSVVFRHNNGANFAYADGRARWRSATQAAGLWDRGVP